MLAKKFSASKLMDECRQHKVTCVVYIGIDRRNDYLVNSSHRRDDKILADAASSKYDKVSTTSKQLSVLVFARYMKEFKDRFES